MRMASGRRRPFWVRGRLAAKCYPTGATARNSSIGGFELAFVPATEQEPAESAQQREDQYAGDGYQEEGGEHARDLERVPRLENAEGEPRLRPAGAGHELGHDGADQRQPAADLEAAQEVGQGRRQAQVAEGLPAGG